MVLFWIVIVLLVVCAVGAFLVELFADDDELHPEDGQDHFPPASLGGVA